MASYRSQSAVASVPAPDDSDFLDSDAGDSIIEQEADDGAHTLLSASQRTPRQMTEMEAELAAVATPCTSQTTSTSYFASRRQQQQQHPKPVSKIMQMTSNFSFAYFRDPAPKADVLNQAGGRQAAGLPFTEEMLEQHLVSLERVGGENAVASASQIAPHLSADCIVHWFNIDSELVYLSFFDDWGPLNVAMFYRFCLHLHHLIGMMQEKAAASTENPEEAPDVHLILYTSDQPRAKANAALLAAMYSMVCGEMTPADAFHPLSELELVPFRDAGYGRADFYLTVQDILYGVHRAISEKLLDLMTFDLDEYETYEQVQNGDWNWITPNIIAFASPNDKEYVADLRAGIQSKGRATPGLRRPLNATFTKTIKYFREHNVKLVVRLNNPLYDSRVFEKEGIRHVDMYFDDGSNPSNDIIRAFIKEADDVISAGGAIAVHCKAGLGRTGVLIGAYLAYKHGFAASESIGFMRIMRPGCVVGPQQHFMYMEAPTWIRWREQDDAKKTLESALEKQRIELIAKASRRRKSDEIDGADQEGREEEEVDLSLTESDKRKHKRAKREAELPKTPKRSIDTGLSDDESDKLTARTLPRLTVKPTPCVGQPRKSPSPSRKRVAQAQAPATIARMGDLGGTSRDRLVSSSGRTFSGSSFSRSIQRLGHHSEAQENVGQEERPTPLTPSGSRVLGEAQRINIQVASSGGDDTAAVGHRGDHWSATKDVKVSIGKPVIKQADVLAKEEEKETEVVGDELFVQGWTSPQPPSVYAERLSVSPSRPNVATTAIVPAPGTPASPSTPTQGARASPHIREKFGLREAGSQQWTPRSRKEMQAGTAPSNSASSSSSASSLTSQDAPGSEDEMLQPGPIESMKPSTKYIASDPATATKPAIAARKVTPAARQVPRAGTVAGKVQAAATAARPVVRTISNSSAGTNRSISNGSRRVPSTNTRRGISVPPTSIHPATTTSSSTTTGRVAAAKDQLAQRQHAAEQRATDLQQRASLKRPRVYSPDLGAAPLQKTLVRSFNANKMDHPTEKFGHLGKVAVVTTTTTTSSIVPRFAAPTAASTAKSQHQQGASNTTDFARFQRGGPLYSAAAHTAVLPHMPSMTTSSRLNGRNVRRRRSSIS